MIKSSVSVFRSIFTVQLVTVQTGVDCARQRICLELRLSKTCQEKPRRSRLAKSLRSHNAAVFVSDKKPQEELDDPWCSDDDLVPVGSLLDDDDNDPDDMDDTTEDAMGDSAQSGNVAVLIKGIEETY